MDGLVSSIVAVVLGLFIWIGYHVYQDNTKPPVTVETTTGYQMPRGLEGCHVYYLKSPSAKNLYVTRCPSETATQWEESSGKSTTTYSNTAVNY